MYATQEPGKRNNALCRTYLVEDSIIFLQG